MNTPLICVSKSNVKTSLCTFRKMKTYYRYIFLFLAGSFAATFILHEYVSTAAEYNTKSTIKDQGNKALIEKKYSYFSYFGFDIRVFPKVDHSVNVARIVLVDKLLN